MTITSVSGPTITFGTVQTSTAGTGISGLDLEHNEQRGPDLSDLGDAFMDPRVAYSYQPGSGPSVRTLGFYNNTAIVDFIPIAANTSAFVVNTGSSGVSTFTLAAASSAGGTFSTTIIAPETGQVTGTLIAVDSTAAFLTFGSAGTIAVWNPGAGAGRTVTIRPSSNLDAGTYSVSGRDMYGYKITELVTGGSTNLTTRKTFKYVSSVTNTTTPTSTGILVGFGDTFGLPLFTPYAGLNVLVSLNSSVVNSAAIPLSSANYTAAQSVSSVATSTTPDVRGTFTSTTASNAVQRLQIVVTPSASAVASVASSNVSQLFGLTQFSSV